MVSGYHRFLDLFAGAGGLSEGFIRAGFQPVAHVEADPSACFTLKTRMVYHYLKQNNLFEKYSDYTNGNISRNELYNMAPDSLINSVINAEIGAKELNTIFFQIDTLLSGKHLDLIIGGPPCQAYSVVGRSRDKNHMIGDKRNFLYRYYAAFLHRYKPDYFVFENVAGLLSAKDQDGKHHFEKMRTCFRDAGYQTEYNILYAEDYGVLQNRKRIFLVGKKGTSNGFYPEPEKWNPGVTVGEIFSDLPSLQANEGKISRTPIKSYKGTYLHDALIRNGNSPVTFHQSRPHTIQDLEIYSIVKELWFSKKIRLRYTDLPDRLKTHKHRNSFLDRFKVVADDLKASQTVVAHIARDGHYYIHPDKNQNRSITPREAARLQTFPDDYFFESATGGPCRTHAYRQIGNAVPVLLAQKIAERLKETW